MTIEIIQRPGTRIMSAPELQKGEIMTREDIFKTLNEVFRDVFDDESIVVNDETTSDDIEDWDSLEHINLIAAVEQEFGVKFTMGQVVTMKNVGEMADIIASQAD